MNVEATAHFSQASLNPLSLARHPVCGVQIALGDCSLRLLWFAELGGCMESHGAIMIFFSCSPCLVRLPRSFFWVRRIVSIQKSTTRCQPCFVQISSDPGQANGGKLLVVTASCVTHAGLIAALLWFNSCSVIWTVICQYYPTDHSVMTKMFSDAQYGSH